MDQTPKTAQNKGEDLILNKSRRRRAKIADKLLHIFYVIHSTITLRRFKKQRPVKKVLVYASMMIGETLIGLEALRSIKQKYPDTTLIINPSMKGLLKEFHTIDYLPPWFNYGEKISLKRIFGFFGFMRKIKRMKFDLAVDLRGDMRNNLILYLSAAPKRVGYGNTGGKYFLTDVVPLKEMLEVKRNNDIAKFIGAKPGECTVLAVDKTDLKKVREILKKNKVTEKDKVVVIIPSAGYWTKVWPKQNWINVIDVLAKKKIKTILLGAPDEKEYSEITKKASSPVIDLIGELSLMQSAAIMKEVGLVVGSDNGGMHLAAAVKADTLSLFGPTVSERWMHYGKGKNKVITKHQYCSPCGRLNDCPINKECMTKIRPEEVTKKILEMIA